MKKIFLSLTAFASLTMASCTIGEKMSSIHPGITRDQVVSVLGRPDGYQTDSGYEVLKYTNKLVSGWSWDKADYSVTLRDGKVIAYGAGQVRQDQNHKLIILQTF